MATAREPAQNLFKLRMELRAAQARFWHSDDPADDARSLEEIEALHREVTSLEEAIANYVPLDGESSCLIHDDPVFGAHNPPPVSRFLYHYTPAKTLPKIRQGALRFGPFSAMNDPHEALDVHPQMGLSSGGSSTISKRTPLVLTPEENERFKQTDWIGELNAARRRVKVGSFTMDGDDHLRDFGPDGPYPEGIARRLHGQRGFAHPRMWAQYGGDSSGVCLILDYEMLLSAFRAECESRSVIYAEGAVKYQSADFGPSLGWIDIGVLLERGSQAAIVDAFEGALLEKHEDWAHEREYRLLVIDDSEEAFFVPIGPGVIQGVAVGPRFNRAAHERSLRAFVRDFQVRGRVCQIDWAHGGCEAIRVVA